VNVNERDGGGGGGMRQYGSPPNILTSHVRSPPIFFNVVGLSQGFAPSTCRVWRRSVEFVC
jgi:hypothetical protein